MNNGENRPTRILLVEDNPGDVRLIREAFRETLHLHEIAIARDGVEALDYLFGRSPFEAAQLPDLILLDLNLPKKGGREVLAEIKTNTAIKTIPVVIFSSSAAPTDVSDAYGLNANCYVTKPADLDGVFQAIAWIDRFWFDVATLPASRACA